LAFAVAFSEEALAILEKLDPPTARRILDKIDQAAENPLRFFQRLRGSELYKLRVGDYRVLARLNLAERKVSVATLGHRRNVYD
jgi:mRNA interferase RelE/StbE